MVTACTRQAGKIQLARQLKQVKYGVSQMFFFFFFSLSLSLSFFKLHFEDKTLVSMPRDLNEQHGERGFDVTIIPKLICLQSQVLRASSVQSVERQRHASEKGKSFLNNVLL